MKQHRCKFCGEPIEWMYVRFGHTKPYDYRWAAVSTDPDTEGRVVFWNDEWIHLRRKAYRKVEPAFRRRLHGPRQCLVDELRGTA